MAHNFFFGRQNHQIIRPFVFEKENLLQVLIPWGHQNRLRDRAEELFELVNIPFDEDATRIKGSDVVSEGPRERLEGALRAINQQICSENPPLFAEREAYEWLTVLKTKNTWIWALSGSFKIKSGTGHFSSEAYLNTLPLDLVGVSPQCFVQSGMILDAKKNPLIAFQAKGVVSVQKNIFTELKDEIYDRVNQSSFWVLEVSELQETR